MTRNRKECRYPAVGLFLLDPEKPRLVYFQGLSFFDLAVTGLSAETLAFLFLLAPGRDRARGRTGRVGIWITLALSAHWLVGPEVEPTRVYRADDARAS